VKTGATGLCVYPLCGDWRFRRLAADGGPGPWVAVELPHSPFVADLDGRDHWFGLCEYSRPVRLPAGAPAGRCALHLGAAMHTAVVAVDGVECGRHEGGYLPFETDLTDVLSDGAGHSLTVRLDNRDNPDIPPGKPWAELDFNWYGGLYRDAVLRCYPPLHITDPLAAAEVAGGGVFVRTLAADGEQARLLVRTHVRNAGSQAQEYQIALELRHAGERVARQVSPRAVLAPAAGKHTELELVLEHPRLWSPSSPALHDLHVGVRAPDGAMLDERVVRCGVRRIGFSRPGGFTINGRRLRLRGTNRHQEFPRVGYALPAAGQRRDARLIKEAGFDYVRCSHYPPAPEFLDACDEFGIVVMDAIPGWQFIGGEKFRAACERNARELVRRDRNHASVVLWELSLNETPMDEAFMTRMHAIGHAEMPGDQMFTCGWLDRFDVFIHSRQHGRIHTWRNGGKALVVAEYGDWEFYAANEGFDQVTGAGVLPREQNSRKRRADGELGLRRQTENFRIALNDTLACSAVLDGQWAMFDYARGYDPVRAACGVSDLFRLPKFAWHFYRSQRDATEDGGAAWTGGAVVFIASHWLPGSALTVPVFTNCEEIELRLNGAALGRRRPASTDDSRHLPHPPVEFVLPRYEAGVLEATGFIDGRALTSHRVVTPGAPAGLQLEFADQKVRTRVGEPDVICVHARVVDHAGVLCVENTAPVSFAAVGDVELLGESHVTAEAGIATVVVRIQAAGAQARIVACTGLAGISHEGTCEIDRRTA
jgi:beta-galactosidase